MTSFLLTKSRAAVRCGTVLALPFAMLAALLGATAAVADDTSATAAGQALAKQWCGECHIVTADQSHAQSASAPSFFAVADDPSVTEGGLRAFLATPHPPMPDIVLDRQQTDEIIAYILSLRGQQ